MRKNFVAETVKTEDDFIASSNLSDSSQLINSPEESGSNQLLPTIEQRELLNNFLFLVRLEIELTKAGSICHLIMSLILQRVTHLFTSRMVTDIFIMPVLHLN